jgi:(E)-4-hydroxy-3-methylbut-2-enyl-diphosphate synthase
MQRMCSRLRGCRNLDDWSPSAFGTDRPYLGVAQQMTAISLGMPSVPTKLAERRKSRQIQVGTVAVGGDAPVSVQSMTTTRTSDIGATLQQIAELTASGCQIVRVACPTQDDADALATIARKSQLPVIADIHFQPKYVFAAIKAGCAAVRVNPGNIKQFDDQVKEIARAAKDTGTPIRIGVNAGSLDKRLLQKYGKATPEALVESALWEASLFEEHDFRDIKISVKHNDPVVMVNAYRQLAAACDYPLHLGVTEAGPAFQGTIKSAVAFGALLAEGIGDTIRVSLSAPPVEEIKVGMQILESLNLKQRRLEIVSCPSCGRAQVDVYKLAEEVTAGLEGMEVPSASPSWAASSTAPARPARPTSASPPATARARSSSRARSSRPSRVEDRRDVDRGGAEDRGADGGGRGRLRRAFGVCGGLRTFSGAGPRTPAPQTPEGLTTSPSGV